MMLAGELEESAELFDEALPLLELAEPGSSEWSLWWSSLLEPLSFEEWSSLEELLSDEEWSSPLDELSPESEESDESSEAWITLTVRLAERLIVSLYLIFWSCPVANWYPLGKWTW